MFLAYLLLLARSLLWLAPLPFLAIMLLLALCCFWVLLLTSFLFSTSLVSLIFWRQCVDCPPISSDFRIHAVVLRSAAAGVLLLLTSSLPGVSTFVDVPSVVYTSTVAGVRSTKLGPEMATSKASAILAPKSRDFQGSPLPMPQVMDVARLKTI
jgi:hypothetical protein